MFIFCWDKLEGSDLCEPDDRGQDHDDVDDGVRDVDEEHRDQLVLGLTDQREVEDQGDGERDQGEQTKEQSHLRLRPVQSVVSYADTFGL